MLLTVASLPRMCDWEPPWSLCGSWGCPSDWDNLHVVSPAPFSLPQLVTVTGRAVRLPEGGDGRRVGRQSSRRR